MPKRSAPEAGLAGDELYEVPMGSLSASLRGQAILTHPECPCQQAHGHNPWPLSQEPGP
jgi:hypothetical protein